MPKKSAPSHALRILVIDDDERKRSDLVYYIRSYFAGKNLLIGLDFTEVGAPKEAIKHVKTQPYDIIVCDMEMKSLETGADVIKAARQNTPNATAKIIGQSYRDYSDDMIEAGADDFLYMQFTSENNPPEAMNAILEQYMNEMAGAKTKAAAKKTRGRRK